MKAIILFAVVAIAFAREQCGENEHYNECGTDCPLTCDNYANPPIFCNRMCRIGCECDKGFVRSSDGRCVRPDQCPPRARQHQCGENEHFNSCGTDCPLTCDNYDNPPRVCNFMCRIGCECDEGYVRSSDGRCVRPEHCPAKAPECGANQHYTTCGTSCPLTCDNYSNPPKICNLRCNIGCACDEGFVLTRDGKCIRPFQCPQNVSRPEIETCREEPDRGNCMGYFQMWYYDAEKEQCKKFIYGGCQGNGNRYESEERCYYRCHGVKPYPAPKPSACTLPAETGVCRGRFPRYFYDVQTGKCQEFVYGGCGGNENNFETVEECQQTCAPQLAPQACLLEKVTGPCKARMIRYYFNKQSGQCEEFVYGGCSGNSNNFHSKDDCEAVCSN